LAWVEEYRLMGCNIVMFRQPNVLGKLVASIFRVEE
jgi:hypothetical protein